MPFPSCVNQPLLLSRNQKIHRGLIGGEARLADLHRARGAAICGSVLSGQSPIPWPSWRQIHPWGSLWRLPRPDPPALSPACFWRSRKNTAFPDSRVIDALFNAGAIGYLAMRNATVAGAVGGCQAEGGLPRLWPPRLPWSSWEELQNSVSMPPRRFSRTCWAWCATPWEVWWNAPARAGTPLAPLLR